MRIRAITLSLMICYGTTAFAEVRATITHSFRPGSSTGIYEPRPNPYPTRVWDRMDLTPTSKVRPSVRHLADEAPPNNCGPRKFEILNPWYAEERCVGAP